MKLTDCKVNKYDRLTLSLALFNSLSWANTCSDTRLHMSDQEYLASAESGDETYTCPVIIRWYKECRNMRWVWKSQSVLKQVSQPVCWMMRVLVDHENELLESSGKVLFLTEILVEVKHSKIRVSYWSYLDALKLPPIITSSSSPPVA